MDDLIERLRGFDKMMYAADCKCGQCAIVPLSVCAEAAAALTEAQAEIARLRGALELAIGLGRDLGMTDMEEDVIRAAALNIQETAPEE